MHATAATGSEYKILKRPFSITPISRLLTFATSYVRNFELI